MATYKIVSGDTASQIAAKYGTTVKALQTANPQYSQFVSNPNYIQAGWTLNLPGTTPTVSTAAPKTSPIVSPAPAAATPAATGDTRTVAQINAAREANIAAGLDPYSGAGAKVGDYSSVTDIAGANAAINAGQAADIATKNAAGEPTNKQSYTELEGYLNQILGTTAPKPAGETTMEQIKKAVTPTTEKPTVDLTGQYETYRTQYGITGLETQLTDLTAQYNNALAAKQTRLAAEGRKTVATNVIEGRQSEVDTQENEKITQIQNQIKTVNDQLTTKYNVVSTLMSLTEKDYQIAADDYDKELANNISMFNTLRGINEDQKTEQDRAQDSARSSLQIIYNSITSGGASVDDLPDTTKTLLTKLEVQAGLPAGFYQTLTNKNPKAEIVATYNWTGVDNKEYASVLTKDATTGEIKTNNIVLGTAKPSAAELKADELTAAEQLEASKTNVKADLATIKGSDGYYSAADILKIRDNIAVNDPGNLSWFDNAYPPSKMLREKGDKANTKYLIEYGNKWTK